MLARLVAFGVALALNAGCTGEETRPVAESTPGSSNTETPAPSESVSPGPTISGADCLAPGNGTSRVRFAADDRLAGYLMGSGQRYVVLAHQSDGDGCQMYPIGVRLRAAGYHVLAFDFSGTGRSRPPASGGSRLAADVAAGVGYVRDRGASSVAVIGASMGGLAALDAGTRIRPPLDALVALSAPDEFGTEQVPSLEGFPAPLQVYVARDDAYFVPAAKGFAREDRSAQLFVLPAFGHGVDLVDDAVFGRIEEFLARNMR